MSQKFTSIIFFLLFVFSNTALAQVCEPNPLYANEPAGVYPQPDTMNGADPTIGITVQACVGEAYEFTFTAIVPNEIEEDLLGTGNPLVVPLNYVKLLDENPILIDNGSGDINTFESITALGIDFICDPPDCKFNANASGCVKLYSQSVSGDIGEYTLVMRTIANVSLFNTPVDLQVNFPSQPGDALTVSDGEYRLTIGASGTCITSVENLIKSKPNFSIYPNPTHGEFSVLLENPAIGETDIKVFNMLGQVVHSESVAKGVTEITPNTGFLPEGIYLLEVTSEDSRSSKKVQVIR